GGDAARGVELAVVGVAGEGAAREPLADGGAVIAAEVYAVALLPGVDLAVAAGVEGALRDIELADVGVTAEAPAGEALPYRGAVIAAEVRAVALLPALDHAVSAGRLEVAGGVAAVAVEVVAVVAVLAGVDITVPAGRQDHPHQQRAGAEEKDG